MRTILIIEDDDAIRDNTSELLSVNHYNVLTAKNGRAGFEAAKKKRPDLILCDIMMPETDGQEFLELARRNEFTRDIPVILFSAGTASSYIQQKLVKAAYGFLNKPFLEEELLNKIENTLKK